MTNNAVDIEFPQQAAGAAPNLPIGLFAGLAALNFFRIGYQLVVAAWSAVQITGRADAPGTLLLISTVVSLVLSPILGAMVDFFTKKKTMLLLSQFGIALAGGIPLFAETLLTGHATFEGIAVAVMFATVFSVVLGGAMDYFLKTHIPQSARARHLATLNSTTQIALILGTAFGGLIVSQCDCSRAFLVISFCGALLAGLSWYLVPTLDVARDEAQFTFKRGILSAGPMLYLKHRRLFSIATCAALTFSIGQITNTLLPALIGVSLHGTSVSYSMIEAAWSVGALLVGLWLAKFAANSPNSIRRDFIAVGGMAGILAAVPFLSAFPALLSTHFLLGAGFALVRIRSETRFLAECPRHLLGRFRANSLFMTSSLGLLIFATPTIYGGASVADLYIGMAGAVAISAIGLLMGSCRPSSAR
jgi:MFS family permease